MKYKVKLKILTIELIGVNEANKGQLNVNSL